MASQAQAPKKSRIILPEEFTKKESKFEDLMAEDLADIDEEIKVDDFLEEEKKRRSVSIQEETLREDFFEVKVEKEEHFGEIEGMVEVAQDEEDDSAPAQEVSSHKEFSAQSEQLSSIAKTWGDTISESVITESWETRRSTIVAAIQMEKETGTEETATMKEESVKDIQRSSAEKVRASKVTICEYLSRENIPEPRRESEGNISEQSVSGESDQSSQQSIDKRSIITARQSIFYDVTRRIEDSDNDLDVFFDLGKPDNVLLMDDLGESIEEEFERAAVEEEELALNRGPYYEKYLIISEQLSVVRIKNNLLQKLVIMYLKRRKVENFAKDVEPPLDQIIKYGQKLDAYQELMEINGTQRKSIATEINVLKQRRDDKNVELNKQFKAMQAREANIGYGLICAKTGKEIPEKSVERFIRRQCTQTDQVSDMRLKFIKLKVMVQEKLDAIDRLDNLGNNLHLAAYEQLKAENRSYADKIEERDEELTRLRVKCQNTIQILAHMREKSAALDSDVCDLRDDFEMVDTMSRSLREDLAYLKHSRDHYRQMRGKIKDESGLLTKPDLLIDFEVSLGEIKQMEIELDKCKEDVTVRTEHVRNLRKNIEIRTEAVNRKKAAKIKRKANLVDFEKKTRLSMEVYNTKTIYKGRPTLFMPIIKQTVFDDLVKIKPGLKVSSKKR